MDMGVIPPGVRGRVERRPPGRHLPGQLFDVEAGAAGGGQLAVEQVSLFIFTRRLEQVAVDAVKKTVDLLPGNGLFDKIDGRGVAGGSEAGAVLTVDAFHLDEAVIDGAGEVGGGASGLAASDGTIIHHQHALAGLAQGVGRRQSGNAGADDADVGVRVGTQALPERRGPGPHGIQFDVNVHGSPRDRQGRCEVDNQRANSVPPGEPGA
jgi:hypothetical protein